MEIKGSVCLVGAGCGKDLITIEGMQTLRNAEVVVYDDLIDDGLLSEASANAEKIYVGKRFHKHSKKQDEINQILVDKAGEGKRVVRLKGGDAFVFGRGGEEYTAVTDAGFTCKVIPGISSAIAVPEHVGIPVTHRGLARSFTVVTGHTMDGTSENFEALAHLDGTLVFLMGLHSCAHISEELIKYGKSPDTPAAIISNGFSPEEKRYDTTLKDLDAAAEKAQSPAVIVIGETAALHFFDKKPYSGVSITVTGTESFSNKTAETLRGYGANARAAKTIDIVPKKIDYKGVNKYKWLVFTSSNGVRIWFEGFIREGCDLRTLAGTEIAVIGKGTADTLKSYGLIPDFIPTEFTAETLGRELGQKISSSESPENERVLILRAANGSKALTEELDKAGILYKDKAIYSTEPVTVEDNTFAGSDYIVFGSAGGVDAFFQQVYELPAKVRLVAIGSYTAEEILKYTGKPVITAKEFTAEGIAKAIISQKN